MTNIIINEKYVNTLDMEGFSRMLNDPSYCYKFFWLEAVVILISQNRTQATYEEVINEMIVNAWYPVLEYHIHLSGVYGDGIIKDNLEKTVLKLKEISKLSNNSDRVKIMNAINEYSDCKELRRFKSELTKNVPHKALSGFANKGKELIDLDSSMGRMIAYYNKLNLSERALPYTFSDDNGLKRKIIFNQDWIDMIQDNTVSILGWIQFEKVRWLQNNNPEVPSLVYKLIPSDERLRKLENVRILWKAIIESNPIVDIFKGDIVNKSAFDVDHFIPRSFVMNDELWNLMPMDSSLNSSKSNKLPPWTKYFNEFAGNQYILYESIHNKPGIYKLFEACFKDNLHSIWANKELYIIGNTEEEFKKILKKNMRPIYDSAYRQGYEIWKMNDVG